MAPPRERSFGTSPGPGIRTSEPCAEDTATPRRQTCARWWGDSSTNADPPCQRTCSGGPLCQAGQDNKPARTTASPRWVQTSSEHSVAAKCSTHVSPTTRGLGHVFFDSSDTEMQWRLIDTHQPGLVYCNHSASGPTGIPFSVDACALPKTTTRRKDILTPRIVSKTSPGIAGENHSKLQTCNTDSYLELDKRDFICRPAVNRPTSPKLLKHPLPKTATVPLRHNHPQSSERVRGASRVKGSKCCFSPQQCTVASLASWNCQPVRCSTPRKRSRVERDEGGGETGGRGSEEEGLAWFRCVLHFWVPEAERGTQQQCPPLLEAAAPRWKGDDCCLTGRDFSDRAASAEEDKDGCAHGPPPVTDAVVRKMIPVKVTESVSVMTLPRFAEQSVESCVTYADTRRHKSVVSFEPSLAPVRFADTLVVFGHDSTKKRYVSRTFYEPRVKPKKFAETDFVFPKEKTERFASFLDYHMDECRRWFKTCMELKARTFTTVTAFPATSSHRRDVTSVHPEADDAFVRAGPGASQVFIPPCKVGGQSLEGKNFRVKLKKEEVDINMNGPISDWL